MKFVSIPVLSAFLCATISCLAAGAEKTFVINAGDTLRFDVTRIEASPGEMLHIQLHNAGTLPKEVMGHNWVLLTADESADAYAAAAMNAKAESFQPAALKNKVLAVIPLLGPGETREIRFSAPTEPGKYAYLCSFPGHCSAGMRGILTVK